MKKPLLILFFLLSLFFLNTPSALAATNGRCGSDHGKTLPTAPTNLCDAGNLVTNGSTGPWTWTCASADGGTSAFCSAGLTAGASPAPINGPYNVDARAIGIKYGNVADLVTFILKAILGFSGAGFLIIILYGAFKYTTSQGDKAGVTEAQKTISSAVIGLAIAAAFFAIISLLQTVLGVSLFNITI